MYNWITLLYNWNWHNMVNQLYSNILGWCKSNCSFALLNFAVWYWNTLLNKCVYVIHHFNIHFSLYDFFANDIAVYFIFILDYRNDVR